jgi:hypothetical protein
MCVFPPLAVAFYYNSKLRQLWNKLTTTFANVAARPDLGLHLAWPEAPVHLVDGLSDIKVR